MNSSTVSKLELLGRIAEMKRIFTVIEASIKGSSCIVVTSGLQGEGKSTLAAGLALSAAKVEGRKVLAVDLNWHAPALHSIFGITLHESEDVYAEEESLEKAVKKTKISNIDVLPALRTDSARGDRKAGVSVSTLLNKAKNVYDRVIVDTAPAYPTNQRMIDPIEICKFSDGVVVVTLTNVTPRQDLKRVCTAIETVGANILGVVANQWRNPLF